MQLTRPFASQGGFAFSAKVPADWPGDGVHDNHRSRLALLEDGADLGPAHSLHKRIRDTGGGSYSHWGNDLYFSSSNRTDPNTNGRTYTIEFRVPQGLGRYGYEPLSLVKPFRELEVHRSFPTPAASPARIRTDAPRVIYWFTIDALRADVPGVRVGTVPVMPALSAFAHRAVDFTVAYATASNTKLSTASMFTGLWPQRHGVMAGMVPVWPNETAMCFGLDPRFYTLAEMLADAGYETWSHRYSVYTQPGSGLLQGFAHVDLDVSSAAPISKLPKRLFVYEHIIGVHAPYSPSEEARTRLGLPPPSSGVDPGSRSWFGKPLDKAAIADLWNAYLAEAADADRAFERRLHWLHERKLYDDALIIVTADHGEAFLEHGTTEHSGPLYEEVVRVPLFVKFPKRSRWARYHGRSFPNRVSLVDLYPTIAELVSDRTLPYEVDGRSLIPIVEGRETDPHARNVVLRMAATYEIAKARGPYLIVTDAVISGRLKAHLGYRPKDSQAPSRLPFARGDWTAELYDLVDDPGEHTNLASERSADFFRLADILRAAQTPLRPVGVAAPTIRSPAGPEKGNGDVLEQLRALGYVE